MNLRAKKSWLAWLLPLFILRAFVPVGFMVSWAGDNLRMVMCAGTGPAASVQAASTHEHVAHGDHAHQESTQTGDSAQHEHSQSKAHDGSYCPFAVAGAAGLPIALQAFTSEPPPAQTFDFIALPEPRSASILIDRIRGPPLA